MPTTRSLRYLLPRIIAGAAAGTVFSISVLIAITSVLHLMVKDLSTAIESLRVADHIELQLLLYRETDAPMVRGATQASLISAVEDAERFVQTPEEQRVVNELAEAVEASVQPGAGDAEISAALAASHRLSMINVEQAREAAHRAAMWDRMSNLGGVVVAVLVLVAVAWFLSWLRREPFRNISAISDAMRRFTAGDREARAPEAGPEELMLMARTFNTTANALVRSRQRQAEYVATALHDLRMPLTAIQLATGYVTNGRPLPPEPRVRELFELIRRQLTRLNGLVGDVLNATWIENGTLVLARARLDLREVTSASVGRFRELAPSHIIELAMPPNPVAVNGDRARLEQVFNNLLSNAVKYSPPGSRVQVVLTRSDGEAALEVSDQGQGVAPEDRVRIFETFRRQSATHEEAPGTSLGLWVSQRVIEAHGGTIELESRMGQGSTFRVILPTEPASSKVELEGAAAPWAG